MSRLDFRAVPDRDQAVNAAVASMEKDQAIGERHLAMNAVIFPPMINFPKPKTKSRGLQTSLMRLHY